MRVHTGVYHRAFGCISPLRYFAHVACSEGNHCTGTGTGIAVYYIIYIPVYIYVSEFHSSWTPGVFYTYFHAHRTRLEKLL